jgi:excisionase family DNA binding protein
MSRRPADRLKLSNAEIERTFAGSCGEQFPPALSVEQAAQLAHVSKKTIYEWSSRGLLRGCAVRKGKRLRIARDRFYRFLFDSED